MPIREFSFEGVLRKKIAFYKEMPAEPDLERFKEREFECKLYTEKDLQNPEFVVQLDAVIFSQKPEKRTALLPVLNKTIPMLLDNDVRVYIRIAPDPNKTTAARNLVIDALLTSNFPLANLQPEEWARIPESSRERETSYLAPYVYIFDSKENWASVAHIVCDHPAGNPPNKGLKIDRYDIRRLRRVDKYFKEDLLLLQRAFFNCNKLKLQLLDGGLSGAIVFKAYASRLTEEWPCLYFVKLGPRKKIVNEYDNYTGRGRALQALDNVPFHLSPRLRLDRCNLGSSRGILVGDFVEGAEPIGDCAPSGRASHAIVNLFGKTLGIWYKQAKKTSDSTLAQYLEEKWLDEKGQEIEPPPKRGEIIKRLGGIPVVEPLREIFNRCAHGPVLLGPAHGDLHAANVLVRGSDAIIIDFEKMTGPFPTLYDPASLESGLLVAGFVRDNRSIQKPESLIESILPLYAFDVLKEFVVPYHHPADPSSWFYDCVAQIRTATHHAELTSGQYALVLALCLIRKGCSNPSLLKPKVYENLRAISFILGQRILMEIGQHTQQFDQPAEKSEPVQ